MSAPVAELYHLLSVQDLVVSAYQSHYGHIITEFDDVVLSCVLLHNHGLGM